MGGSGRHLRQGVDEERVTMTPEQAAKLRAPFPSEQVGKLPKPTKKDNPKGKCSECGGWHGLPAVHLDYVGHAAVTDRLLQVDPGWSWEPMARGSNGEPLLTNGGLWINLTVCGVTRPGFGDESNGKGMKEVIGDAIRNAAMRFGVALDLWAKENLHAGSEDAPEKAPTFEPPGSVRASLEVDENTPPTLQQQRKLGVLYVELLRINRVTPSQVAAMFGHKAGPLITSGEIEAAAKALSKAAAKSLIERGENAKANAPKETVAA